MVNRQLLLCGPLGLLTGPTHHSKPLQPKITSIFTIFIAKLLYNPNLRHAGLRQRNCEHLALKENTQSWPYSQNNPLFETIADFKMTVIQEREHK
jgi:hypothetical protein